MSTRASRGGGSCPSTGVRRLPACAGSPLVFCVCPSAGVERRLRTGGGGRGLNERSVSVNPAALPGSAPRVSAYVCVCYACGVATKVGEPSVGEGHPTQTQFSVCFRKALKAFAGAKGVWEALKRLLQLALLSLCCLAVLSLAHLSSSCTLLRLVPPGAGVAAGTHHQQSVWHRAFAVWILALKRHRSERGPPSSRCLLAFEES